MFKKIALFFRKLNGTKPCKNLAELIAYIPKGNIYKLQFWISQVIWYMEDVNPDDEWEEADTVLGRNPPQSDCEEKALIPYMVMRSWDGWKPMILCVYPKDDVGHAVCAFERPDGVKGWMDDGGIHLYEKMYWKEIAKTIAPWVYSARWKDEKGNLIGKLELQ